MFGHMVDYWYCAFARRRRSQSRGAIVDVKARYRRHAVQRQSDTSYYLAGGAERSVHAPEPDEGRRQR